MRDKVSLDNIFEQMMRIPTLYRYHMIHDMTAKEPVFSHRSYRTGTAVCVTYDMNCADPVRERCLGRVYWFRYGYHLVINEIEANRI